MNNVVTRSLVMLAVSTALVLVAAFALPARNPVPTPVGADQEGMAGHGMSGMSISVDSEAAFITGMIPHHQEAVASAQAVLETTERPEVRELARDVIETQTQEIAMLEGWLTRWYPDAAEADYAPMMTELTGLSSDEADRTFLEGMIGHHRGAIDMAQSYLNADFEKQGDVVQLAEAIVSVQDAEITQMQAWLDDWYGNDASHDMN
jgi:Uncharacterized protein conserved in bacteria